MDLAEHLKICEHCREFAQELEQNAAALRELTHTAGCVRGCAPARVKRDSGEETPDHVVDVVGSGSGGLHGDTVRIVCSPRLQKPAAAGGCRCENKIRQRLSGRSGRHPSRPP